MSVWIAIGSGPSAAQSLRGALRLWPDARTIATNGGIEFRPAPDVYVLIDQMASHVFAEQARQAQWRGTKLVTLRRCQSALKARDVDWYDEFVSVPGHSPPAPGKYGSFVRSGLFCLEYACMHGASKIVLVGWDGYAAGYSGGAKVHLGRAEVLDSIMNAGIAEIRAAWPDVLIEKVEN